MTNYVSFRNTQLTSLTTTTTNPFDSPFSGQPKRANNILQKKSNTCWH